MADEQAEALKAKIEGEAAAAAAAAQASLQEQVNSLAEKLIKATDTVAAASEAVAQRQAPVAANAVTPERFAESIEKAIEASGGKTSAGVITALQQAIPAVLSTQAAANAGIQKQLAMADPTLRDAKGTPLMKRFEKEITAFIKQNGLTDQYLEQRGYGDIVTLVAAKDTAFQAERNKAVIDEYVAAQKKEVKPAAGAVAVEGVQIGQVAPQVAAQSEEQAIAAIKVDDEQASLLHQRYRLSKADVQRQKHEIAQQFERYGAQGIRQLGGIPVCDLSTVPVEHPVPGRAQRFVQLIDND